MMKRGFLIIAIGIFLIVFISSNIEALMQKNVIYRSTNCSITQEGIFDSYITMSINATKARIDMVYLEGGLQDNEYIIGSDSFYITYYFHDFHFNGNGTSLVFLSSSSSVSPFHGWFKTKNMYMGTNKGYASKQDNNTIILESNLIGENSLAENNNSFVGFGEVKIDLGNKQCSFELSGLEIENFRDRISTLEFWKNTIDSWKTTLTTTITTIQTLLTGQITKIDNQETRISVLESSGGSGGGGTGGNISAKNYFKYLSSTDRKNIICGYAEDNHLIQLTDLGWNCIITYRQTSRGETSSCRCKAVK